MYGDVIQKDLSKKELNKRLKEKIRLKQKGVQYRQLWDLYDQELEIQQKKEEFLNVLLIQYI